MLLSLKVIKGIETAKVEVRLALQKLSEGIQKGYQKLLISQHQKRDERLQYYQLKKGKVISDCQKLLRKIDDEKGSLLMEKGEIFDVLFNGKTTDNSK